MEKSPKDAYLSLGKLSRHLIASNKLTDLLEQSKLSEYVHFKNVILKNKNGKVPYNYYHFYESMWDYVDICRSKFKYISSNTLDTIEVITFDSMKDYTDALNSTGRDKYLVFEEIVIPGISKYDCFPLLNYSESVFFISYSLNDKILKNNLKVDTEVLSQFQIRDVY